MGWCSIPGEIHTSSMDGITFARRSHTAEPKNREILVINGIGLVPRQIFTFSIVFFSNLTFSIFSLLC